MTDKTHLIKFNSSASTNNGWTEFYTRSSGSDPTKFTYQNGRESAMYFWNNNSTKTAPGASVQGKKILPYVDKSWDSIAENDTLWIRPFQEMNTNGYGMYDS